MNSSKITLTTADQGFLETFRSKGEHSAREINRAHILLGLANDVPTVLLQRVLGVSRMLIWRTRTAFLEGGLAHALHDSTRSGQPRKYGPDQEAEVVALACSSPPPGAARWTLRALTDAARQRPNLAQARRESIRQMLKKTSVSLGGK